MEIVHLAGAAPRGAPVLCSACRPTPVLCHSWAAQMWNRIPGGLEGGYFICFLFRERQTGWAFISVEKETLAKSNTQRALKKQDVQDMVPGFTLVPPLIVRTELERK